MDIITNESLNIYGHPVIGYQRNTDHLLFSQTNYHYPNRTEIVVTGWYHEEIMNTCDHIVAVWRVKKKLKFDYAYALN